MFDEDFGAGLTGLIGVGGFLGIGPFPRTTPLFSIGCADTLAFLPICFSLLKYPDRTNFIDIKKCNPRRVGNWLHEVAQVINLPFTHEKQTMRFGRGEGHRAFGKDTRDPVSVLVLDQ